MSVISTFAAYSKNSMDLGNIEMKIKLVQDEVLALSQAAQQAVGNPETLKQMHDKNIQLEQELKLLELEYTSLKERIEQDKTMQKNAIKRGFSSTIA